MKALTISIAMILICVGLIFSNQLYFGKSQKEYSTEFIKPTGNFYRGVLAFGFEGNTYTDCESGKDYYIEKVSDKEFSSKYLPIDNSKYTYFAAEFLGESVGVLDYNGLKYPTIDLIKISKLSKIKFADCEGFNFAKF